MKTQPTLALIRRLEQLIGQMTLSALLFALTLPAYSQYDLLFQSASNNSGWTRATAVADDGAGNAFMAGTVKDTLVLGSFVLINTQLPGDDFPGKTAGFIGKYNSNSDTWLWATMITLVPYTVGTGGVYQSNVSLRDITIDNAANVYVTGTYHGTIKFGTITLNSTKRGAYPTTDIFVAKVNANGSFGWAKSLGAKDGDEGINAIALDGSNNVYVSGYYIIKKNGCSTNWANTSYAIYVAKLNNAGSTQWEKKYPAGSSTCDFISANDVTTDASGNVYATGLYAGTVSFGNGPSLSITSVGSGDVFILKLNSAGTTQWVRSGGSVGLDEGYAVYTETTGTTYVCGRFGSNTPGAITFGGLTLPISDGDTDGFIVKYSSTGAPLWLVNPGPAIDFLPRQLTPHNGALLASSSSAGFTSISPADGSILTYIPFEINGSPSDPGITGSFFLNDTEVAGTEYVFAMKANCGTITVDGMDFSSTCTDCSFSCAAPGGDLVLVRSGSGSFFAPPLENHSDQFSMPEYNSNDVFVIFPNPADHHVVIQRKQNTTGTTFHVIDQLGRVVHSEFMKEGQNAITIDLDKMEHGVYFISTVQHGEVFTQRLVIAR